MKWMRLTLVVALAFSAIEAVTPAPHSSAEESEPRLPNYQTREEIPKTYKWNLEDIYTSEKKWKKDMEKVEALASNLSDMAGHIGESSAQLKKAMDTYVQLSRTFEKIYTYAKLSFHTNKSDQNFQRLSSIADDLAIHLREKVSFFIPELQSIPQPQLTKYLGNPELREYRRWIEDQISEKDHTLSIEMEELLAKSESMANAPENIFGMLMKDLTFPAVKNEIGEEVALTPANYSSFMKKTDREVRKRAYEAYYKTIDQFKDTFSQILFSEVKKNVFYSEARNYPSTREASLESNRIPLDVYDNLIETVHKHLPELHRYIRLKKKEAGLAEMHLYDIYVDISRDKKEYIPFERAKEMMKEGLAPLGSKYRKLLESSFKERWFDVYPTPGKRTGAFQWGAFDTHPFILLNYQGQMGDVYTMAHEFGHAAHSYFSRQNQGYLDASYPIFTAEVASTTNEALLFRELYQKARTNEEKIAILAQRLEDYTGTLFLQTMFAEFEKSIHEQVEKGEAITAGYLNETYGALLKTYFGEDLKVDPLATLGWARIPHFYRNYYVYQYATGFAAANAFVQQMVEQGEPAVYRYMEKFLSAGNSKDPIVLLKEAGVDMNSPEVIEEALKGFTEGIEELEMLLRERENQNAA